MKGDRYAEKRFSVPASAGKLETCVREGHAWADKRGKCVRCGSKIRSDGFGELMGGLNEALAHAQGKKALKTTRVRRPK